MSKTILFLSGMMLLSSTALANDLACTNLYAVTCAPGVFDDGTGVIATSTDSKNKSKEMMDKVSARSRETIRAELAKPENVYQRQLVLAGTLASGNSECDGAEQKPSDACLDLMADATNTLLVQNVNLPSAYGVAPAPQSPLATPNDEDPSLADKNTLVNSQLFIELRGKFLADLSKEGKVSETDAKVRDKVFPAVKALLINKVQKLFTDEKVKSNIISKIQAIKYLGTDCTGLGANPQGVSSVFMANAFYNQPTNAFHYCGGESIQGMSEFQLAALIGHELTHSFDPCSITQGPSNYSYHYSKAANFKALDQQYPLAGVVNCLRSDKSVHAHRLDEMPPMQQMPLPMGGYGGGGYGAPVPLGGMYPGPIQPPMVGVNGNPPGLPGAYSGSGMPPTCANDQITESMADWMSREILPEYIDKYYPHLTPQQMRNGYSNVFRGDSIAQCQSDQYINDTHPTIRRRINNIIMVQPRIREQMGCPPNTPAQLHCDNNYKFGVPMHMVNGLAPNPPASEPKADHD